MIEKRTTIKDKETRTRQIQIAAREVFFERGYASSTIEEIAKRAGIAKGTVYLYFDNKDDLYISLMFPMVEKLSASLTQLQKEVDGRGFTDGSEIIECMLDVFYTCYRDDPEDFTIAAAFQLGGLFSRMSDERVQSINRVASDTFSAIRGIISKGKRMGLVKEELNEIITGDVLWGTFIGILHHEENKRRLTGKDHVYETLKHAFLLLSQGICNDSQKS